MIKNLTKLMLIGLLFFSIPYPSFAVTVPFELTVTGVDADTPRDDPWNIGISDVYAGMVTYDESLIPSVGDSFLCLWNDPSFNLSFSLGTQAFDMSKAVFPPLGPALLFSDSVLQGFFLSVFLDDMQNPLYNTNLTGFQFFTTNVNENTIYEGTIDFDTPNTIPEPSTMLLIGLGLLGFIGVGRRGKRQAAQRPVLSE